MFGCVNHLAANKSLFKIPWCFGDYLKKLEPPGPITGLLSYPGSGNTWIRDHSQTTLTGFLPLPGPHPFLDNFNTLEYLIKVRPQINVRGIT